MELLKVLSVYLTIASVRHVISQTIYDPRLRRFQPTENNTTNTITNSTYSAVAPASHNYSNYHKPVYYFPQRRQSTPEIAKYRNEGNFYQAKTLADNVEFDVNLANFSEPPALFDHAVYHVEPTLTTFYEEYRPRRNADTIAPNSMDNVDDHKVKFTSTESIARNNDGVAATHNDQQHPPTEETRYFHDIFMRYNAGPQKIAFGHVERRPELLEKRFESQNKGNRYKGEVIWADETGGYGEHRWDLAQGKL